MKAELSVLTNPPNYYQVYAKICVWKGKDYAIRSGNCIN